MAYLPIRFLMLQQLASADLTVTAIAEKIGAIRNSVAKSVDAAHGQGVVHITDYCKGVPIYRHGPGQDAPRPVHLVPEDPKAKPIPPVVPVLSPSLEYFEMADLLPGVRHFTCARYRSTLSIASCADRYQKANATSDPDLRLTHCRGCPFGAGHCGQEAPNESPLFGRTICGRCRTGATRLIGKHLCISCYNRARELRIGANAKGTAPINLARLDQRSITFRAAGGGVKTRVLAESVDTEELVIAVLRDSVSAVQFGWCAPAATDGLIGDEFDRSIGDSEPCESTAGAGVVTDVECDAVPATAGLDVLPADAYAVLRAAVDQLDAAVPACAPGMSRRSATKLRQKTRRQVRVSNLTVAKLRGVGALPAPVVSPRRNKLYSPLLFASN